MIRTNSDASADTHIRNQVPNCSRRFAVRRIRNLVPNLAVSASKKTHTKPLRAASASERKRPPEGKQ